MTREVETSLALVIGSIVLAAIVFGFPVLLVGVICTVIAAIAVAVSREW